MANVGLAPREVRIVILTIGLLAAGAIDLSARPLVLGGCLGLIAVLASATTIQRILHVRNQARED
jgi:hypothetical protein